ncbi:hypothetical protein [Bernardetia sp.]|uniref:hypothetical protein n=1 Tax=Bernardetia sp. TaxID=1937974 RepID=UPI0025B9FD27|nr:hypothetical protein [Bernardetia sp.]
MSIKLTFLFFIIYCFSNYSVAQKNLCSSEHNHTLHTPNPVSYYSLFAMDSLEESRTIDSLEKIYGQHKNIPQKYRSAILIALSYYPELIDTPIDFKECEISTTLNARPTIASLCFKSRKKRSYTVRINNSQKKGMITIDEVPFNARIGIFAHEFSHFIDYQNRTFGGVLERLWAYTSDKAKAKYEREIDSMTVARGLKWQLYDWSYYAINLSDASESYKEFKRNTYLRPSEIIEQIRELKN